MRLIATDEAGYGPKLGPLVVAATAWELPSSGFTQDELDHFFEPLRQKLACGNSMVVVNDSKAVYKPGGGLEILHAVASAAARWLSPQSQSLSDWIDTIDSNAAQTLKATPWLRDSDSAPLLGDKQTDSLIKEWNRQGATLCQTQVDIVPAKRFNALCQHGNKAEVLSASTIKLVADLLEAQSSRSQDATVFCDRHGGRRYYAGLLQHHFPDSIVRVVSESKMQSVYEMQGLGDRIVRVHFTVKGDSFTPVAFSSMIAKYLRERAMESFNAFFQARHQGDDPLKATAGYPVDADRFLSQIAPIIESEKIERDDLIRRR